MCVAKNAQNIKIGWYTYNLNKSLIPVEYSTEVRSTTIHDSLNRSLFLQESARISEQTATVTSAYAANCAARELLYVYAC